MVSVRSMTSERSGQTIPNQLIIRDGQYTYFQSYDTIIARKGPKGITLDRAKWNCSKTTAKYLRQFLGMGVEQTRKAIASGEIKLAKLNK